MTPIIIAYLLNLVDYAFTARWVNKYGLEIEANPIGGWMLGNGCAFAIKVVGMGILFAILALLIRKSPRAAWVRYLPLAVYSVIVTLEFVTAIYILCIERNF